MPQHEVPQTDYPWSSPVIVNLQSGGERTFASTCSALEFLENDWPLRSGRHYDMAVRACRGTLKKMTPCAVAREAFMVACREAGLPSMNGMRPLEMEKLPPRRHSS